MKGAIRALAFTAVLPAATLSAAPTYPDVVRTSLYVPVRDGTKLAVNIYRPARDGIHVVRSGDALMVKRPDLARPGVLALVSDNPAYRTIELAPDEVQVIGRVVWKSGRL